MSDACLHYRMQLYKYDSEVAVNIVTWYLYDINFFLLLRDCVDTFDLHYVYYIQW